jgi:hypothetical protein
MSSGGFGTVLAGIVVSSRLSNMLIQDTHREANSAPGFAPGTTLAVRDLHAIVSLLPVT